MEEQSFDLFVASVGLKAEAEQMEKMQREARSKRGR